MVALNERIKQLREEAGMSQAGLSEVLGQRINRKLSKDAVGTYERGKTDLSTTVLSALADIYSVSIEYLLGKTDDRKSYHVAEERSSYTAEEVFNPEDFTIAMIHHTQVLSPEERKRLYRMIKAGWPELFQR